MRTIGRRWPEDAGPDRQALCSYCGVQWRRSELTRDPSQNLACPDCAPGLDVVSLSEGNARLMRSRQPKSVGPTDGNFDQFTPPPDPGFVAPNGPPPRLANQGPTGPLDVAAYMWLRSDVVLQANTNGLVSTWVDQSNRGNHVPAPTAASQPIWNASDATLGGLPTVTGNGVNHWLETRAFVGGAPLWLWIIYKQNNISGAAPGLFTSGFGLQSNIGGNFTLLTNGGTQAPAVAAVVGQWQRAIVSFNTSGVDTLLVGSATQSYASTGQRYSAATSLFGNPGGGNKISATVAEVLLTSGPPNLANITAIEAYGVARYGGGPFA